MGSRNETCFIHIFRCEDELRVRLQHGACLCARHPVGYGRREQRAGRARAFGLLASGAKEGAYVLRVCLALLLLLALDAFAC